MLGWSPTSAVRAAADLASSGRYCIAAAPTTSPRPAVSLSNLRTRALEQGSAGVCWATSPAQLFEITARSEGYTPIPACRRLIGYEGKRLEGGGNPSDGGSPTDAIRTMIDQGVGVADEALCPYTDDPRVLGQKPPASVYADAGKHHLVSPVAVQSLDQIVALIDGKNGTVPGLPTANGYMCPDAMQQQGATFISSYRRILGGHSQLFIGYAMPGVFDKYLWLQLDNWWGKIYKPLPAALAAKVVGYQPLTPTATSDVWIRSDVYLRLLALESASEHVSATGVSGLDGGVVTPAPGWNPLAPV